MSAPNTKLTDDPVRPTPADLRSRTHADLERRHQLAIRQHSTHILGALLSELANDREFVICERVSHRLWNEGLRDLPWGGSMAVRDWAKWALANPHKICL